jgi:hypothetical protein
VVEYTVNNALLIRVELLCHNHMVVQRTRITNESRFNTMMNLEFDPKFILRDLDYTTRKLDIPSVCRKGPHGHSLLVMEDDPPAVSGKQLFTVIGLFKDGISQELQLDDTGKIPIKHELSYRESLEYVAVFKVQYRDLGTKWQDFVITGTEVNQCFGQMSAEVTDWEWPHAAQADMRWSLRRNLEHILTVCSLRVPIKDPVDVPVHIQTSPAPDGIPPEVSVDKNGGLQKTLDTPEGDTYLVQGAPDEVPSEVSVDKNEGFQIFLETPEGNNYLVQEGESNRYELRKMNEPQKRTPRHEIAAVPSAISLTCGDFGDHRVCISGS